MDAVNNLIKVIAKMPGVGYRLAKKIAIHLIKNKDTSIDHLIIALGSVRDNIMHCEICNNADILSPCNICIDPKRDASTLCVIEDIPDLWAMNSDNAFFGLYHILGGALSAIDGITPESLKISLLQKRVASNDKIKEVIIATNSTIEGQTTAYYIHDLLQEIDRDIKITRLAHGMPIGAELDYMDKGTLNLAMKMRHEF